LTENRVRIVEADDAQISSAVIGNSGLYEQTIRLKDGHLISKCSCSLPEEPMCRHCIAVLLEYHRWAQPRQSSRKANDAKEAKAQPQSDHATNGKASSSPPSAPDIKLSEVMQFVEWLQPAMKAIEKGEPVPEAPKLGVGEVSTWIQTIKNLEDRRRDSEEVQLNLESDMRDREAYVGRLTQQLQTSIAEAKTAQATSQELQREMATYKGMLAKVSELVGEAARYDGQIRSVASEILSKGTQLDKLAGSFKELAEALKSATKQSPPR
jgi:ribosomal protein L11